MRGPKPESGVMPPFEPHCDDGVSQLPGRVPVHSVSRLRPVMRRPVRTGCKGFSGLALRGMSFMIFIQDSHSPGVEGPNRSMVFESSNFTYTNMTGLFNLYYEVLCAVF